MKIAEKTFLAVIILISIIVNVFFPISYAVSNEVLEKNEVRNQEIEVNNTDESNVLENTIEEDSLLNNNIVINSNKEIKKDFESNKMENEIIQNDINDKEVNQVEEDTNETINNIENNVEKNLQDSIELNENSIKRDTLKTESSMNSIMLTNLNYDEPGVKYRTHVQNVGWQDYQVNGNMAGTEGRSLRLEAIDISLMGSLSNINVVYQTHVQNIGWQDWKTNGQQAGTEGMGLRLEAIRIFLQDTDEYSIMYRVHIQNIGWQDWKKDAEVAGTEGRGLRLEAIQIKIVPKEKKGIIDLDTPKNGYIYYTPSTINVRGWKMANVSNTVIQAFVDDVAIDSNSISYYNREDITSSHLTYGTPTQNQTAGFAFNIDANNLSSGNHIIKILLYSNSEVIGNTAVVFNIDRNLHVTYRTHVENIGWQDYVLDGNMAGTEGRGLRVEALDIHLINAPSNARIVYRAHVQNVGWQDWKANGEQAGTEGRSLRVEALEIKLENLNDYTVEYKVHIQNIGWTGWFIDGETAGTVGQGKRIEAVQIRFVSKYKRKYKGIDVSVYNNSINWGLVKNAGIDFAMIRVGYRGYGQEGNFAEDNKFRINIQSVNTLGIPAGIYFFSQAITEAEAIEEANWVVEKIKEYRIDYPVAVDVEKLPNPGRTDNLDKSTRTRLIRIFCEKIKEAGYTPMIYTNIDGTNNMLDMSQLSDFETWIAHYKNDENSRPDYNGSYTMWQYTSKGSIPGILGNVDMNIGYKKYK